MRTAEEFAGDQRQIELLNDNVSLISMIQSPSEIQKLAFQGKLSSGWKGSENLYKASLLSVHEEYKGESLGYLRSAENWLKAYFESKNQQKDRFIKTITSKDIAELFTVYLNLFGESKAVEIVQRWYSVDSFNSVIDIFIRKLLDNANFEVIDKLATASKNFAYISIHCIAPLYSMQNEISKETLTSTLKSLLDDTNKKHYKANLNIPYYQLFLFIECCIKADIEKSELSLVLDKYIKLEPKSWYRKNTHHHSDELAKFIQFIALKQLVTGKPVNEEDLIPPEYLSEDKSHEQKEGEKEYRKMLGATLPMQLFLTSVRTEQYTNFLAALEDASNKSSSNLPPRYQQENSILDYVNSLEQKSIFWAKDITKNKQKELASNIIKNSSYRDLLFGLYHTTRVPRLAHLAELYSIALSQNISSSKGEGPESMSSSFIDFSIAIFPLSQSESAAFLEKAIEAVSKFGNEALVRHMALLSLAQKSAKGNCTPELTYRFSRGSEVIYEYMSDHFPLDKTIKVIHDMNGASAFGVLARWLDRDVAYIGAMEDSLFEHSINSDSISAENAWCAQSFIDSTSYAEFLFTCLKKCKQKPSRHIIFSDAVNQALIKTLPMSALLKIQTTGASYSLSSDKLDSTILLLGEQERLRTVKLDYLPNENSDDVSVDWGDVFNTSSLTNPKEIEAALARFNSIKDKSYEDNFWEQLYCRVSPISAVDIINAILKCDLSSTYELQKALENTPEKWFERLGVKEIWSKGFDIFVQKM